jgi:hypothetical protein
MTTQEMTHTFLQEPEEHTRLNKWIFDAARPFIKGRTVEIQIGWGSMAPLFIAEDLPIHLSDPLPRNLDRLVETYKPSPTVRAVHAFHFTQPDFADINGSLKNVFDTVIAINAYDLASAQVFANFKILLRQKGHLIIVGPASTVLYHGLEEGEEQWKKYNYKAVMQLLKFEFKILCIRFFNRVSSQLDQTLSHHGLSVLAIAQNN